MIQEAETKAAQMRQTELINHGSYVFLLHKTKTYKLMEKKQIVISLQHNVYYEHLYVSLKDPFP